MTNHVFYGNTGRPLHERMHPAPWRLHAALVIVALALAATSISVGFCTDDYGFRALLRARPHAFVDMFRFATGDLGANHLRIVTGHLPWWTAPDFRLHLLRPLTGALFAADVDLFGDGTLGYHLHSLAWYAALLVAAARLFRRLLVPRAASFALAVLGLRSAHVLPYAWISARHLVVGGALAAWALVVQLGPAPATSAATAARAARWRPLAAAVLFALALAGSEAALGGIALAVALEIGVARERAPAPWRSVLARLAPLLAVTLAYLAIYRLLGAGARASGDYHDPLGDPARFLQVAVMRIPALLADALLAIPVILAARHALAIALAGAVAAGIVVALLQTSRVCALLPRRLSRALGLGALAGVVVGCSGTLGGRVLLVPDLGFAALVGTLLAAAFPLDRSAFFAAGAGLALLHLVLAPLVTAFEIADFRRIARATDGIALGAEIPRGTPRDVFLVAASDPFVFLYPRAVLADRAPGLVDCWSVLSAAPADHRVERVDERTLRVRSEGRPLLTGFDALFRSPGERPFSVGDEARQCGATFKVEAVDGGRPTGVLVTFAASLDIGPEHDGDDDDRPVLLQWDGAGLRRFVPPPVSGAVEIPWRPGPRGR